MENKDTPELYLSTGADQRECAGVRIPRTRDEMRLSNTTVILQSVTPFLSDASPPGSAPDPDILYLCFSSAVIAL